MDLYFERCDGTAATVEDFLAAFAEVTGRDLGPFARWYAQAGTPRVAVSGRYDAQRHEYRLDFSQSTPPTPEQPMKEPVTIPILLGLVAEDGSAMTPACNRLDADGLFVLDQASDAITFQNVPSRPVPSVFRGFSAPVKVDLDLSGEELLALLRHDPDPFNRWQSAHTVALRLLVQTTRTGSVDRASAERLCAALLAFVEADALGDPAFAALVLTVPGESEVAQEIAAEVDPDAIFAARVALKQIVGERLSPTLVRLSDDLVTEGPYTPDAASAGRRALRHAALDLAAAADPEPGLTMVASRYHGSGHMTERLGALGVATQLPASPGRESLFADFRARFEGEPLVLDKWFALQAMIPATDTLPRVKALMGDPAFAMTNPNRVRSLIGSFALNNPTQFHRPDGAGYEFLADIALQLDASNPQLASRLLTAFGTWKT
jgi:aminopeptidase N